MRPDLSFAWVRREPNSSADPIDTLFAGARVIAFTPTDGRAGMVYDGAQWWGYVRAPSSVGWLELTALILVNPNPPNPFTPAPPVAAPQRWVAGNVVRVRASVPFVYLRTDPASSQVAGTLNSGSRMIILGIPVQDSNNSQAYWWQVREATSPGYTVGWVEEASLEFVRARANSRLPALPPDFWRPFFTMRIRAALPFAWLRAAAASDAPVLATLRPGDEVTLRPYLSWDGVQNWRQVTARRANMVGYIEESALEFVRLYTYP